MAKQENNTHFFEKTYKIHFQTGLEIKMLSALREHFKVIKTEDEDLTILLISDKEEEKEND